MKRGWLWSLIVIMGELKYITGERLGFKIGKYLHKGFTWETVERRVVRDMSFRIGDLRGDAASRHCQVVHSLLWRGGLSYVRFAPTVPVADPLQCSQVWEIAWPTLWIYEALYGLGPEYRRFLSATSYVPDVTLAGTIATSGNSHIP
jgi:hypothetical protein